MGILCQTYYLMPYNIKDRWEILNPFLKGLNAQGFDYMVCQEGTEAKREATFYLHGFGGDPSVCPELNDVICPHTPLIRVQSVYREGDSFLKPMAKATFGDVCAMLHNARQAVYAIADMHGLDSYNIVAHSWGGFISSLVALNDRRCKKAMLLTSTPDICDALSRMYEMFPIPKILWFLGDIFMGKVRVDAEKAKYGRSWHQKAWDSISPYGYVSNPEVRMLIFNRTEDKIMRRENVEHFISHARGRGISNVTAEFNTYSDLSDPHDMPPRKFMGRMEQFLWGDR